MNSLKICTALTRAVRTQGQVPNALRACAAHAKTSPCMTSVGDGANAHDSGLNVNLHLNGHAGQTPTQLLKRKVRNVLQTVTPYDSTSKLRLEELAQALKDVDECESQDKAASHDKTPEDEQPQADEKNEGTSKDEMEEGGEFPSEAEIELEDHKATLRTLALLEDKPDDMDTIEYLVACEAFRQQGIKEKNLADRMHADREELRRLWVLEDRGKPDDLDEYLDFMKPIQIL